MKTIPLTQGKVALVDDADYEAVSQFKWHAARRGHIFYASRKVRKPDGKQTSQFLHQFLIPGVPEIAHLDGEGLNNQRKNLRSVTHRQNMQSFKRKRVGTTSKFRGVSRHKQHGKWVACIEVDGDYVYLGIFENELDAARAYNEAALRYFGELAHLNAA